MYKYNIKPVLKEFQVPLIDKINNKTKPLGSLGRLESLAVKIGCIQNTLSPSLTRPTHIIFAADHGIAKEGVSLYPQEVTYQMVLNFLNGGAAINVFCKQHGFDIKIVDSGINADLPTHPQLIDAKIAKGTANFLEKPAMTDQQCLLCFQKASEIVQNVFNEGSNVISFGEMGIANTSPASLIFTLISGISLYSTVGKGAGLDDNAVIRKRNTLQQALEKHKIDQSPFSIIKTFGGFEINMMTAAMLKAAELKMIVLIDGFIATAAVIAAQAIDPNVLDYCIFAHKSKEQGHIKMLQFLQVEPLLDLDMRLGEGTGAIVAYPIIQSAVAFINEMASFDSANVTKPN